MVLRTRTDSAFWSLGTSTRTLDGGSARRADGAVADKDGGRILELIGRPPRRHVVATTLAFTRFALARRRVMTAI